MLHIDAALLNATERLCRRFQLLTGRTNVWLAFQLTNLSIVIYFVWAAGLYLVSELLALRIFVTLFCGFLDVQAGEFVYSNGGHPVPILASAREASLLPLPKGALLGASSGRHYASLRCTLAAGETLFCYTDGVTEAESPTGAQFSVERCLKRLRAGARGALPELLDDLHAQVVGHTGSPALADDCTMLAVRRPTP